MRDFEEIERNAKREEHDGVRDEKSTCKVSPHVPYVFMHMQHVRFKDVTSSIFKTQIREPPHIAQTNGEPERADDVVVQPFVVSSSVVFVPREILVILIRFQVNRSLKSFYIMSVIVNFQMLG